MANSFWKFFKGIAIRPETTDPTDNVEGSIFVNSTDDRVKTYIEGSVREVITEDQSQTLENKEIVVADNTVTTAASGNLAATELNAALSELQTDIDDVRTDYVKRDGSLAMTGDLDLDSHNITNVTDPSDAQDAATKNYVDALIPDSIEFTESYAPDWTAEAGPMVKFNNGTGENAGVIVEDVSGTGESTRPLIIGTGARTNAADSSPTKFVNIYTGANHGTSNSGPIYVQTGYTVSDVTASGKIALETGSVTGSSSLSGDVELTTGPASGGATRGKILLNGRLVDASNTKITNVADPSDAQDVATKNYVDTTVSGSGADTALSNLITTSINQTLLPSAADTKDVGSASLRWANFFGFSYRIYNASTTLLGNLIAGSNKITLATPDVASGTGTSIEIEAGGNATAASTGGNISIYSKGANGHTGAISLTTGNASGASSNSGNISITTGTSSSGTRGSINLDGKTIGLNASASADPGGSFVAGATYYNTTTKKFRYYNGTAWGDVDKTVSAAAYLSSSSAISADTQVPFDTSEWDSGSTLTTGASFKFTALIDGIYQVTGILGSSTGAQFHIYKNGSKHKLVTYASGAIQPSYAVQVKLAATDYIDLRPNTGTTMAGGALTGDNITTIQISRIADYV